MTTEAAPAGTGIERASTLELFLDLVFVFTITQLTELVAHPHGAADYVQAALILLMTWWMYDGWVWLTGNIRTDRRPIRLAIFAGMGGYLLMALAIPGTFGATDGAPNDAGLVFGLGYLLVTVLHTVLFTTAPNSSATAIWRIAPFNVAGALLVLTAAFVDEDVRWVLWVAAVVTVTASTMFGRVRGFAVSSSHFVERHGLVIIVALGESVVAIGTGAGGLEIDAGLALTALLALALSATLWWAYFDRDDQRAEEVIGGTDAERRGVVALAVAYTHVVMIAGIVLAAAGIKVILAHPTEPAETAGAWNLAVGVALYLLGETAFRRALGVRGDLGRLAGAALALATVPIGLSVSAVAQLAAAVLVMVAALAITA